MVDQLVGQSSDRHILAAELAWFWQFVTAGDMLNQLVRAVNLCVRRFRVRRLLVRLVFFFQAEDGIRDAQESRARRCV